MSRIRHDLVVGLRMLRRRPAFAITASSTLALGIGLSTAVYTVADALLLRRLPVADQDRIVVLWGRKPDRSFDYPIGVDDARQFARQSRLLERVGSFAYEGASPVLIREGDQLLRLRAALVSGTFFEVLGAKPLIGRALRPSDDVRGAEPVIVLSYGAWQRRFARDANVLGRRVTLHRDGATYTVVGVMPQGLEYPRGTDFWAAILPAIPEQSLQFAAVNVIGRLPQGATLEQAREEITRFFKRPDAPSWLRDLDGVARSFPTVVLGETRPALFAFVVASGLLLLIASLNVANLLLVRGLARAREMAVRSAIGATRADLVRQLLTESSLLAAVGGVLGILLASGAVQTFVVFAPATLPRLDEVRVSSATLGGALGLSVLALLCFAVAPAMMASRESLYSTIGAHTRHGATRPTRLASEALAAIQMAFAVIVLSAAGIITRSLLQLQRAEMSFDHSRLLIAELALRYDQLSDTAKQRVVIEQLLARVQAMPEVQSLSPVVAAPFSGSGGWDGSLTAKGQSTQEAESNPMLNLEVVAPSYFETFGLPVLRGRGFAETDHERAPRVLVISESVARHYWPGADPIGRELQMSDQAKRTLTVIGVVPDTRYRDLREARPSVYYPLRQSFFPFLPTTFAIRTKLPPSSVVPALRRAIAETAPNVALASAAPFDSFLAQPLSQPRLNTLLLVVFGASCTILAGIGLFGVMASMVRQRTRELGVRMALGATADELRLLVMRRGARITAIGLSAGLFAAVIMNRFVGSLLFEVRPVDVTTLVGVVAVLLGVSAMASFVPARASTRINPVIALRAED